MFLDKYRSTFEEFQTKERTLLWTTYDHMTFLFPDFLLFALLLTPTNHFYALLTYLWQLWKLEADSSVFPTSSWLDNNPQVFEKEIGVIVSKHGLNDWFMLIYAIWRWDLRQPALPRSEQWIGYVW